MLIHLDVAAELVGQDLWYLTGQQRSRQPNYQRCNSDHRTAGQNNVTESYYGRELVRRVKIAESYLGELF